MVDNLLHMYTKCFRRTWKSQREECASGGKKEETSRREKYSSNEGCQGKAVAFGHRLVFQGRNEFIVKTQSQTVLKIDVASERPIERATDNCKYKPYRHSPSFYARLHLILARARVVSYLIQFISGDFSRWFEIEVHGVYIAGLRLARGRVYIFFSFSSSQEYRTSVNKGFALNLTAVSGRESTAADRDRLAYFTRPSTRPGTDSTPIAARNWDTRSLCCLCARNHHASLDCTMCTRRRRKSS